MKVKFCGAIGGEVTGSCTYFKYERTNTEFLVDCGMYQGGWNSKEKNKQPFPFLPSEIKFIILTHAHLDHCGLIPRLYREGFTGEVICTSATAKLTKVQLYDAVKFADGLFDKNDLKVLKFRCVDEQSNFGLSRFIPIDQDLTASFTRSAHILGSVSVNLCWSKTSGERANIVLSGDIGGSTKDNPYGSLLAGTQFPYGHPQYLVLESTYGSDSKDKEFTSFENRTEKLAQIIKKHAVEKNKLLIIPAFSLQRTQEILFDLYYVLTRQDGVLINASRPDKRLNKEKLYDGNGWPFFVQEAIDRLKSDLPDDVRMRWNGAFEEIEVDGKQRWIIKEGADVTLEEVQSTLSKDRKPCPIDIFLDAPLARKMTKVFGKELNRRQNINPEEPLFRNRMMASRLGLDSENEVDEKIKLIFPRKVSGEHKISVGQHTICYTENFSLPSEEHLKGRGNILITGSGMCDGGPIVKHLMKGLERNDVTVMLTGYMARDTLGNKLTSIAKSQIEEREATFSTLEVGKRKILTKNITAEILEMGSYYSGHADLDILLSFVSDEMSTGGEISSLAPMTLFLNHGEDHARANLKHSIENHCKGNSACRVQRIELPSATSTWFDLDLNEWVKEETKNDGDLALLLAEQKMTNKFLERIVKLLESRNETTVTQDSFDLPQ